MESLESQTYPMRQTMINGLVFSHHKNDNRLDTVCEITNSHFKKDRLDKKLKIVKNLNNITTYGQEEDYDDIKLYDHEDLAYVAKYNFISRFITGIGNHLPYLPLTEN